MRPCAGGAEGSATAPCQPGGEQAGLIAERLADGASELRSAWVVPLDPPVDNYFYVVAAEIGGDGELVRAAPASWP